MKLIALDVGTKRIGVAKADSNVRIAVPYAAVEVDGNEFNKIASLARAWDINCFVLGMPRNSQGEETKQSEYVRQFARELKRAIPEAKVCFQDESLTSVEAEKRLKSRKKGYKKGDIDSEAATIILQDFLEQHTGKTISKAASAKRRPSVQAPARPHHIFTVIFIILLLLAACAGGCYYYYTQNLQPVFSDIDCSDAEDATSAACKDMLFTIEAGSSVNEVAGQLKNAGLIRSSLVFQVYYRLNYSDYVIKTGDFNLNKTMTPQQIIEQITDSKNDNNTFSFMVTPGETLSDIKAKLIKLGYTAEEIETAFSASYAGEYSWIFEGRPEGASLEGYLFGDTYEFYKGEELTAIFERMLEEMASVIEENGLKDGFAAQGLNLYQSITLASVVQKEASAAADQAKVAQVFYNRMNAGMNLGSDVTVSYAWDVMYPDRDPNEIPNSEKIAIDSPYNTRLYTGLPYGPICNPGLTALKAVATPDGEASNYLFFLTGDDGLMYYSATDGEHQQNIIDHCKDLCSVAL